MIGYQDEVRANNRASGDKPRARSQEVEGRSYFTERGLLGNEETGD